MNQSPEPQTVGSFRLYPPPEGMTGWTLSWKGEWLPGSYADERALLLICGLFLGGNNSGLIDELMELLQERYNMASRGTITVEDILRHYLPNGC